MKDITSPDIAILGMGAIGTLLAFHWQNSIPLCISRQGNDCRREMIDLQQQSHLLRLRCWNQQAIDWLVVTTKAADTLSALKPLQPKLHLIKHILLIQNGMGQQQAVADWLAQEAEAPQLWAGISTEGAYRESTERVIYAGAGETVIGPWEQHTQRPPEVQLNCVQTVDDIQQRIRAKLAINAVINPLTAIHRCLNGELVTNSGYRLQMVELAEEIQHFFQQQGWKLPFQLAQRVTAVATATGNNRSSTLQDVLKQRPTELTHINGYLWRLAQQQQKPLPVTQHLLQQLGEI